MSGVKICSSRQIEGFGFGRVALGSGISIHYAQRGKCGPCPVIFLHGYVDSWRSFAAVFEHLGPTCRIVAPDLRGHGNSDKPEWGYSLDDYVRDLLFLMEALGLERADLVGHSMGSFIAQRFASRFPARVGRLVLISSAASMACKTSFLELKPSIEALEDPIPMNFAAEFQATSNPVPADFMEMILSETIKAPAHVWRSLFSTLLEVDHRPILGDISAPALILWGNQDQLFTRSDQEVLLAAIPDSRFEEFATGHCPHWEKPGLMAEAIEKFLC